MNQTYTVSQVAEKIGVAAKTLRRWEESGRFSSVRTIGGQRRYNIEDIQILDAIKQGTIPSQSDLLTKEVAADFLRISPTTLEYYASSGIIHPFITAEGNYYSKTMLTAKLHDLPVEESHYSPAPTIFDIKPYLINFLITLAILFIYHTIFTPIKQPTPTPEVKGIQAVQDPTLSLMKNLFDTYGNFTTAGTINTKSSLIAPKLSLTPSLLPTSSIPGELYFDAGTQTLRLYDGNIWQTLGYVLPPTPSATESGNATTL